jgi:uncharacterized repeat protein (TIGR03803 family)
MKVHKFWAALGTALAVLAPAVVVAATQAAQAQTYSVLYSFGGKGGSKRESKHGANPGAGLIEDKNGNFYGTTYDGGAYSSGTVFRLDTTGAETVLYSFTRGADGGYPQASLVRDSAGNLYGTTLYGGAYNGGVVFKLDTTGAETVLYSFTGGADGGNPQASLVRDAAGNLYGTTVSGGGPGCFPEDGCGTVFRLESSGNETVLHSFTGGADGGNPYAALVRDSAGNLYGTTGNGGAYGWGVVFELKANGREKVLYSFTGGADGGSPTASLVRDSVGTLYGTTYVGGRPGCGSEFGCGTVFKVESSGNEAVLYSFTGGADGGNPFAGLVRDSDGNLYGTTFGGGYDSGVVFKLKANGKEKVLHRFAGVRGKPYGGLVRDSAGNLYGTTYLGGAYNEGAVFKITPQ